MRLAAIIFFAALIFGLPSISHAQYNDNDEQNPKEYHDEDSQLLSVVSDVLYPVGYGLEWLVARPLHYVKTDSAISPMYRPVDGTDDSPPPPAPIIPDNTLSSTTTNASGLPQDWSPTRGASSTAPAYRVAPQQPAQASPPPSTGQPTLH